MIYREAVQVRVEDFDQRGNMMPSSVLKLLENASCHHSEAMTKTPVLAERFEGTTWLLTDWQVEIDRIPTYRDTLTIETWITGKAPCAKTYRNFLMLDASGELLVKGQAILVLYSIEERRIVQINEELLAKYQPEQRIVFGGRLPRVILPSVWDRELPITVRKSDIDYNGHVHNTSYLDFAMELLPDRPAEYEKLWQLRIAYKASLKYGDEAVVKGTQEGNCWKIGIFCGDKAYTMLEITAR